MPTADGGLRPNVEGVSPDDTGCRGHADFDADCE